MASDHADILEPSLPKDSMSVQVCQHACRQAKSTGDRKNWNKKQLSFQAILSCLLKLYRGMLCVLSACIPSVILCVCVISQAHRREVGDRLVKGQQHIPQPQMTTYV